MEVQTEFQKYHFFAFQPGGFGLRTHSATLAV
jgi:hypothetical protein